MNDFDARRDSDESAVRSAALLVFVQAAARQEHDAEALTWERMQTAMRRDAEARAARRSRGIVVAVTALAAAVALTFAVFPGRSSESGTSDVRMASDRTALTSERSARSDAEAGLEEAGLGAGAAGAAGAGVNLEAVEIPVVADAAALAGRGTAVVIDEGAGLVSRWSGAALSSVVAAFSAATDSVSADVRRSSRDGEAAKTSVARDTAPDPAELLAIAAEDALARGDRAEAIAFLEKIVRKHSRSRQARAAMLDVARLRNAAGDRAGATCAYQRFLERYPSDEMRPDVTRRLSALDGADVECRGIDPAE